MLFNVCRYEAHNLSKYYFNPEYLGNVVVINDKFCWNKLYLLPLIKHHSNITSQNEFFFSTLVYIPVVN